MATKKVNIDIIAKDKSRRALGQVRSRLDRIKKSAFSVKGALAGIGAALVIRKIVAVSAEFEDLRDSLSSVTGSVEKGQEAFNFIKIVDLKNETCPMTFVKTRLELEKINVGEKLKVYYSNLEAKDNVPKSLSEIGHKVLETKSIDKNIFFLLIEKC